MNKMLQLIFKENTLSASFCMNHENVMIKSFLSHDNLKCDD